MISLLWREPPPREREAQAGWEEDLVLAPLVRAISGAGRHDSVARTVLAGLCNDPVVIVYRQDVLEDLLALPVLAARLETLLPALAGLAHVGASRWASEHGIFQVAGRLAELEIYVDSVQALLAALEAFYSGLRAEGWLALYSDLQAIAASAEFQSLVAELPTLRAQIDRAGSVTIGVNLDEQLRPESATLLGVSAGRFGGPRSLLGRLLGPDREVPSGITPLRQAMHYP